MSEADGFVEAVLEAPLGLTLLADVERRVHYDRPDRDSRPYLPGSSEAVEAAVEAMAGSSFGQLVELAVFSSTFDAGPWNPDAPEAVAEAYRLADARAPIAIALNDRFGPALHVPIGRDQQQWWRSGHEPALPTGPLFRSYERVYDAGQFSWAGLWTVTDPPAEAHEQLVDTWEFHEGPVSRWHLPLDSDARVFEIRRPSDWVRLVTEHPKDAATHSEHWELPSVNQDRSEISDLLLMPGQRAARAKIGRHLVPDWRSVADAYDGVHLSWAGFITSEGCISDLGGGDVAMLRYWFSERTHWLHDVFGEPQPLGAPVFEEPAGQDRFGVVDVEIDLIRQAKDRRHLLGLLDRPA